MTAARYLYLLQGWPADLEVALVSMARAASTSLCLMQKSMAVLPSLLGSRAQFSESSRLMADGLLARQAQCSAVHCRTRYKVLRFAMITMILL